MGGMSSQPEEPISNSNEHENEGINMSMRMKALLI
jgi:hypothetical protein